MRSHLYGGGRAGKPRAAIAKTGMASDEAASWKIQLGVSADLPADLRRQAHRCMLARSAAGRSITGRKPGAGPSNLLVLMTMVAAMAMGRIC